MSGPEIRDCRSGPESVGENLRSEAVGDEGPA